MSLKSAPSSSAQIRIYEPFDGQEENYLFLEYHLNSMMIDQTALLEVAADQDRTHRQERMEHWRTRVRAVFSDLVPETQSSPVSIILFAGDVVGSEDSFEVVSHRRRSLRDSVSTRMPFGDLSYILRQSLSITHRSQITNQSGESVELAFRTVPSGGGLFPIEAYLIPLTVDDLKMDLYHVDVEAQALQGLGRSLSLETIAPMFIYDQNVTNACVLLILTARFYRSSWKYGERSYRFVLLEAGAILHQISLAAEAIGYNGLMIGGYYDNLLEELVDCNGEDEAVVITGAIGRSGPETLRSNTSE